MEFNPCGEVPSKGNFFEELLQQNWSLIDFPFVLVAHAGIFKNP